MISRFYKNYGTILLWMAALSFPILTIQADKLPTNNNIETWLPENSEVRSTYDDFRRRFGAEEVVLIGISNIDRDIELEEALARRIETLSGVGRCLSPERLKSVMLEMGVGEDDVPERLIGFVVADGGSLVGLVVILTKEGIADRTATVEAIRGVLDYCQIRGDDVHLAGAPVVVSELNRLAKRENNAKFFMLTLLISLCLLYVSIRRWVPSLVIVGLTVWAINLTTALIKLGGGEMNFILGALPVMVMVFTLAISIHLLHYFRAALDTSDPLGEALRMAWKPCCLATLTTTIGLMSLCVSDIGPVRQFGVTASLGCVVALITGLGITPAVLVKWPISRTGRDGAHEWFSGASHWLLDRAKPVAVLALLLVMVTATGLVHLKSKFEPLDFLPAKSKLLSDLRLIERDLTYTSSVEAVVDFEGSQLAFVDKMEEVRRLQSMIAAHPSVGYTMSAATFFPTRMPESSYDATRLLKKAQSRRSDNSFTADNERFWKISSRVSAEADMSRRQLLDELETLTAGEPITFTGISPLLESAQRSIFNGFWESFAMAFVIITLVMIASLRSLKLGLVAMIPNLTPICIVFGTLGWLQIPIDIGMMMTGSIALGIAVDGTFHFLVRYNEHFRPLKDSARASRSALLQTGSPIFQAAAIAAVGMLAMMLSNFGPMARFGMMMATLLAAALIGDLALLPALLALRPARDTGENLHKKDSATRLPPPRPHLMSHPAMPSDTDAVK